MKTRNPWKIACLTLATGVVAAGAFVYSGTLHVKSTAGATDEQVVPSEMVLNPSVNSTGTQHVTPITEVPKDQTLPADMKHAKDDGPPPLKEPKLLKFKHAFAKKTAKLVVHVIDGRTGKPLPDAENVLIETGQRFKTDNKGTTQAIDAPVIREEKYEEIVAALHGQLGLITYKNGYRDSITFGVRMHENRTTDVTVWMYKIEPGDRRIEPVFYHEPYHHLWLVNLVDAFRSPSQPGAGPQSPKR